MEEKQVLILQPDDKRLGRDLPDGRRWPEIDLNGQPVEKERATTRHLTSELFVVIPHRWVGEIKLAITPVVTAEVLVQAEDEPTISRKMRGINAGS